MNEEDKMIEKLRNKLDLFLDKFFDEEQTDRAFYEFDIKMIELNDKFRKYKEHQILSEQKHYCIFCGKETTYYYNKKDDYICVDCYKKLEVI